MKMGPASCRAVNLRFSVEVKVIFIAGIIRIWDLLRQVEICATRVSDKGVFDKMKSIVEVLLQSPRVAGFRERQHEQNSRLLRT